MFKIFFRCRRSSPWFDSCPSKRDPTTAGQVSQSCHNSWTAEAGFRRHSGFQSTLAITIPLQQLCLAFSSKIFEKIEFNKMIEWILAGSERRNESAEIFKPRAPKYSNRERRKEGTLPYEYRGFTSLLYQNGKKFFRRSSFDAWT